jgi:carbonic anhydrase
VKKLIQGIVEFRRNVREGYREAFGRLAVGQSPDTLFIACSDSRVVPNTFASTNPGDLFVLRNVGNLVPKCDKHGISASDESEAAAIEFSVLNLNVSYIIVCGHSECGAMRAIANDRQEIQAPNLKSWLRHGEEALDRLRAGVTLDRNLTELNQLSQVNVLLQMEHVLTYPLVQQRMKEGKLALHGWWFDIAKADVYAYESPQQKFVLIDEIEAEQMLSRLQSSPPLTKA